NFLQREIRGIESQILGKAEQHYIPEAECRDGELENELLIGAFGLLRAGVKAYLGCITQCGCALSDPAQADLCGIEVDDNRLMRVVHFRPQYARFQLPQVLEQPDATDTVNGGDNESRPCKIGRVEFQESRSYCRVVKAGVDTRVCFGLTHARRLIEGVIGAEIVFA